MGLGSQIVDLVGPLIDVSLVLCNLPLYAAQTGNYLLSLDAYLVQIGNDVSLVVGVDVLESREHLVEGTECGALQLVSQLQLCLTLYHSLSHVPLY